MVTVVSTLLFLVGLGARQLATPLGALPETLLWSLLTLRQWDRLGRLATQGEGSHPSPLATPHQPLH